MPKVNVTSPSLDTCLDALASADAGAIGVLAIGMPGHWEMLAILAIGLLLFGKRLPEVGRSLGRSIVEFKKGVKGIQDEIEAETAAPPVAEPRRIDESPADDKRVGQGETIQRQPASD